MLKLNSKLFIALGLVIACIYVTSPVESPGSAPSCTNFCKKVFGNSHSAYLKPKIEACKAADGLCYDCGPKATAPHTDLCKAGTKNAACCDEETPDCCHNKKCVNKATDTKNCGWCGHKCHMNKDCCGGNCLTKCTAPKERNAQCACTCPTTCPNQGDVQDPVTCQCKCGITTCPGGQVLQDCNCNCPVINPPCPNGRDPITCLCTNTPCPFPSGGTVICTDPPGQEVPACDCGKYLNASNNAKCPGNANGRPCVPCIGANQLKCGKYCCDGKDQACSGDVLDEDSHCVDNNNPPNTPIVGPISVRPTWSIGIP